MKYFSIFAVLALLFVSGCTPKVIKPTEQSTVPTVTERRLNEPGDEATGKGTITEEELARRERERQLQDPGQTGEETGLSDVGFDYDSYAITPTELPKVEAAVNWLKGNSAFKISVEGHCDERGTMEYNLALGQKRADTVKDYLAKMGIDRARVKSISFGKEMPVDPGHSEDAWAKNRRAHFRADQTR